MLFRKKQNIFLKAAVELEVPRLLHVCLGVPYFFMVFYHFSSIIS